MQKLKRVRGVDCMSLKRIKLMLFSAIILVGLFFFIQIHQTRNVEKQKTSNIVGKLLIDTTGKEEPIVLNPLETKNHRTMILPYLKEEQNECLIDLSFLGFDKKLKLTAYDIGYVTENNESSCIQVSSKGGVNATDSKEKKSNGNCLILVVSNQIKSIDSDNYIVVLDYLNHKKYIYKTNLLFSWVRRPVLQLADITGDGRQEIIVSNVINGKTGTSCEVIRYDKDNDVFKSIYANPKKADADHVGKQIEYFSGYLIDNYRAVLECKRIGYSTTFSILDSGYKKEDFEIDKAPKDKMNDIMQDCRVYKKGKLIKNGNDVKIQMGPLDEYEGIQVHVSSNGEKKIRLKYYIRIGRWNTIAIAYAYMDYDKNNDCLKIADAVIETSNFE